MPTLNEMIDDVRGSLQGYTLRQDRITYVANPSGINTTDTEITVGSASNLAKGVIEIDDELIWIDSFDKANNVLNVIPGFGRGFQGTNPAPHSEYAQVTLAPTFPRVNIKKAINDTINAVGSTIFAAKVTTFTFNAAQTTYDFDGLNIQNILSISWQSVGPSLEWIPVRRWSWDSKADATAFGATAQTVTIGDYITPGRTVKVVYATDPVPFTTNAQDFSTQTGLPESCKDVIVLGASYRLLTYLDPARAAQVSPQADETDSKRPYGASQTATKQLYALYTQRLNEETARQQSFYPIRVHYSR